VEDQKAKQSKLRQDIQLLHVNTIKRYLYIFSALWRYLSNFLWGRAEFDLTFAILC